MSNCRIESGVQLFSRLTKRPDLTNIYPILIQNSGPKPREVIEVCGETSTGKTLLITEFLAKCLLPEQNGGKNADAIIINTDHHFHMFKLVAILEQLLKSNSTNNSSEINDIINNCLKRLIVLNCYESNQFYVTIQNLENIITNPKISLLVLDSLNAYYWIDRFNNDSMKNTYIYNRTILKSIQNVTNNSGMTVLYTIHGRNNAKNDGCCSKQPMLEKINYRIHLQKVKEEDDGSNRFVANVTLPNNIVFKKHYKIGSLIEWQ